MEPQCNFFLLSVGVFSLTTVTVGCYNPQTDTHRMTRSNSEEYLPENMRIDAYQVDLCDTTSCSEITPKGTVYDCFYHASAIYFTSLNCKNILCCKNIFAL